MFDLEKGNPDIEQEEDVFQIIENMTLKINLTEHAPRVDQEYVRLISEGESEQNLDKLYDAIEAGA